MQPSISVTCSYAISNYFCEAYHYKGNSLGKSFRKILANNCNRPSGNSIWYEGMAISGAPLDCNKHSARFNIAMTLCNTSDWDLNMAIDAETGHATQNLIQVGENHHNARMIEKMDRVYFRNTLKYTLNRMMINGSIYVGHVKKNQSKDYSFFALGRPHQSRY